MENKDLQAQQQDIATVKRVVRKRGKGLAWVLMIFAIFYIIWPIDLIPNFIPIIGWIDDALVGFAAITNLVLRYRRPR